MTEFEIEWPQLKMRNSSKRIRRTHGVGLVLIQQLLFSQMPELIFFALGPTAIFPDLVGTRCDFLLTGLCHEILLLVFRRHQDLQDLLLEPIAV